MKRPKVPTGWRRLRVGEVIRRSDYACHKNIDPVTPIYTGIDLSGLKIEPDDGNWYYRKTNKTT